MTKYYATNILLSQGWATDKTLTIEQGIIMVCTPDLYFQEFKFSGVELRSWKHKFLKRLDEYYKLTQEYKPKFGAAQIDAPTLLKEFEKDK